jgi:hypothetical protein
VFVPDVEKKLRADRKQKSIQAATHDSAFRRARVISLDIVRDVPCIVGGLCLLIAVHVHIHRPLPHERR